MSSLKFSSMKKVFIDWDANLIQQFRLMQAISECGYEIKVKYRDVAKFKLLKKEFCFEVGCLTNDTLDVSEYVEISHEKPYVKIGGNKYPLVFPKAITEKCLSLWKETRSKEVSFLGLMTDKRSSVIRSWLHY